jgi:hypothetical protein
MSPDLRAAILALALPHPDRDTAPADVVITQHAVLRYQERVEAVPEWLARRRLRKLLTTARWRNRPDPSWPILIRDRTVYGYTERRPGVWLVVRDGALRTVLVPAAVHIPAQRRTEP